MTATTSSPDPTIDVVDSRLGAMLYGRVPKDYQTRVFGLVATVAYAGFPLGGLLGGAAVTWFGLSTAILLGGGVYLAATLVPLLRYRRPAKPAPAQMAEGPAEA